MALTEGSVKASKGIPYKNSKKIEKSIVVENRFSQERIFVQKL